MTARLRSLLGLAALACVGLESCSCSEQGATPEAGGAPSAAGALPYVFTDVTRASGLAAFTQVNGTAEKLFVLDSFGAGVALFDAENDGDLDAYLTNGSKLEGLTSGEEPADALFLNDGGGRFQDGTAAAGLGDERWTTGVRTVDLDGDGDTELYLTNYGPNVLYDNAGAGKFVDVTERAGVGDPSWSTGAAFLDFDKDGDLDLCVANYLEFDREVMLRERPRGTMNGHSQSATGASMRDVVVMFGPMGMTSSESRFYVNQGGGRFRDASQEVGIAGVRRFSFEVLAFDADVDGWLDLLVVNDVVEDSLWHNEAGQRFTDVSLRAGMAVREDGTPQGGMGAALGDYDGDLSIDLFVTNYVQDYSTLFRGAPGGFFRDVTARMGLRKDTMSMVGWGCGFVDFDSDGDLELYEINGHVYPQVDRFPLGTSYKQKNQLWELQGNRFAAPAGAGGPDFNVARAGRGAATGDIDGDGDVDLLVGNIDDHPTLLRNDGPNGHGLDVLLVGSKGNRDAIGARLVLRVGEKKHLRLVGTGGSFLSSNSPWEHFGLGSATRADELEVTWPDGRVERFIDLAADQLHTIEAGANGGPSSVGSRPYKKR